MARRRRCTERMVRAREPFVPRYPHPAPRRVSPVPPLSPPPCRTAGVRPHVRRRLSRVLRGDRGGPRGDWDDVHHGEGAR